MHHVTLDGTWTHDGDFDHEVVERTRLEPWQHRHLRARFDLKDTHRIGLTDHVVGRTIFCWDRVEAQRFRL